MKQKKDCIMSPIKVAVSLLMLIGIPKSNAEYTALYLDDSCDTTCHKQLTVDNKGTGSIFSQRSAKFESGVNKKVTITAPPGYIIHLDFEKLSFNLFGCSNYVQLFDGEDDSASKALTSQRCQGLFSRSHIPDTYSRYNVVTILFKTTTSGNAGDGFKLNFEIIKASNVPVFLQEQCKDSNPVTIPVTEETPTHAMQIFSHRGGHYDNAVNCAFILTVPGQEQVTVQLSYLSILSPSVAGCEPVGEYIKIYDGASNKGTVLGGPWCGSAPRLSLRYLKKISQKSSSNIIYGEFRTSNDSTGIGGFELKINRGPTSESTTTSKGISNEVLILGVTAVILFTRSS